jgi:hypothetical protein
MTEKEKKLITNMINKFALLYDVMTILSRI